MRPTRTSLSSHAVISKHPIGDPGQSCSVWEETQGKEDQELGIVRGSMNPVGAQRPPGVCLPRFCRK